MFMPTGSGKGETRRLRTTGTPRHRRPAGIGPFTAQAGVDVQIVVVRYFGGILLGTGGLTRAYGGTARLALEEAGLARLIPHIIYNLNIPYPWYEQIKYGVKQQGWSCANEQFSEIISLEIYIPEAQAGTFENWIDEFTNKQVSWTKIKLELKPDPTL